MRRNSFRRGESGQSLVIVALMLTMLLGFTGLVIDVGWFEVNLVRVQRAADAAALAGVVYLPGNPGGGATAAKAEATRNGYTTDAATGVNVTAAPDPGNSKVMLTSVTAPVNTFFARLFGVTNFVATRRARAEFILPVPMGSPLDYWGIHVLCRNSDNNNASPNVCPRVASATGVGTLNSLGYWGAIEMRGTQRANGDAYSTFYDGGTALNTGFDPNGYSYIVEVPAGSTGGALWVYDPLFCATGAGGTTSPARRLGVGDFWLGTNTAVTTEFKLWDMRGTPYSTSDDVIVATDGGIFSTMNYADRSAAYAGGGDYGSGSASSATDCAGNVYHNNWWRMANNLAAGDYRLQVVTSAGGSTQNAVNNFGLQVTTTSGTGARVYGQTRMCVYNAISGTSLFYLAQVDAVHAGKTLEIKLFDPGDIASTSLRVKIPTSTGYTDATFSFTATGSTGGGPLSGTGLTSLTTSTSSVNYYNNQWVTITVNIPTTYGATGPASITPPGEPGPGWWKIQYVTTGSGQDVTTWEVNIRGNPVHLVIP
jgi:hypothetical protein